MHSRKSLVIVFATAWLSVNAQVSLDSSEFPLAGRTYSLTNVAFVNIPPVSASGPGQTYGFTGGFIYDGQLIQYNDAMADPFSTDYPTQPPSPGTFQGWILTNICTMQLMLQGFGKRGQYGSGI